MTRKLARILGFLLVVGPALGAQAEEPEAAPSGSLVEMMSVQVESGEAPVLEPEEWACIAPELIWVDAEYLLWWIKGTSLPPLVTASPAGTPREQAGVLGTPGTTVLFGDSRVNGDLRSGGRFTAGMWCSPDNTFGIEGSFLFLESRASNFSAVSGGSPILARPFVDATTGQQTSQLVAFPGDLSGAITAAAASTGLIGAGALTRSQVCCGCNYRLDVLAGYRFLRLTDSLDVGEDLVSINPANAVFIPVGTRIGVSDHFATRNEFHGFDVGLAMDMCRGPFLLRLLGKVALGGTDQSVDIAGQTNVIIPGLPATSNPGGLLALASNGGHHSREVFSVVPEIGVKVGYQITPQLRALVGYSFLDWCHVVRAGDQVNLAVNPNLIPPPISPLVPLEPSFRFQRTNLWVQGIDLGFELRF